MIIKKINLYLFVIFIFSINTLALSNDKIVYINVDFILKNSNLGKIIVNELKEVNNKNLEKILIFEKEIKKENDEIKKIKNVITEDEFNKKVSALNKKINEYKVLKKKLSNEITEIEKEKIQIFFEKVNPLIQDYMDKNSIEIIIDKKNIFIARSKSDITGDIVNLINLNLK